MAEYPRGSEWRRWDLHIHTPGTARSDGFTGATIDEKWDRFYSDIAAYIGDGTDPAKAVSVIGITDYLSLDNYLRVVTERRLPDSVLLVLPNVEMRMQPPASQSPINIHFIFDPLVVNSIEDRFFGRLSFRYGNTDFGATKSELIRLGNEIDPSLSRDAALKKGAEQYVVSFDVLRGVFDKDHDLREHVFIAVSNKTNDGVSGAVNHSGYGGDAGSQLLAFRRSIYRFVDAIFSATLSDIDYFLGRKSECPESRVIAECGSLKPCIHGSDAHENSAIFEPRDRRYCWIKADPTFNGLKQVKYEPADRVRIQELKPEVKSAYHVIDRVIFHDHEFQSDPVYFGDRLTCIIGGKSTGKSILLHNLALALDREQAEAKTELARAQTKTDVSLTAYWADNESSAGGSGGTRKIVYVPQTYLNRLCDAQAERTEVDEIIESIILRDEEVRAALHATDEAIRDYKAELTKAILDLCETQLSIDRLSQQIQELGDRAGIESEKTRLESERERFVRESSLTEQDVKAYEAATARVSELRPQIGALDADVAAVREIRSIVEGSSITHALSEDTKRAIKGIQSRIVAEADSSWENERTSLILSLSELRAAKSAELADHQATQLRLQERIQGRSLAQIEERIATESKKLAEFDRLGQQKRQIEEHKQGLINSVVSSTVFFRQRREEFAGVVNSRYGASREALQFSVDVPFKKDAFIERLKSIMDTGKKVFKDTVSPDDFTDESYTPERVSELLRKVLSGELVLKKGHTTEKAMRDILDDWFEVKYRVKMGGDLMDAMSPGKKALVLLKLLIELAESKCPILIDQPEDDLDNRSIFDELIPFIREKKKERQIIVVTHNANIVVGADADQVIVANQHGETTPNRDGKKFEYRTGSIENDTARLRPDGSQDDGILSSRGIQQHICDILEGGTRAFELRRRKYHI
ncbi:MAG: TrlF family AAA-like ATPase [Chloroflexota bacterium]